MEIIKLTYKDNSETTKNYLELIEGAETFDNFLSSPPAQSNGIPQCIKITNTDDIRKIKSRLSEVGYLILEFPAHVDGRAYSQARILRQLGYKGEILAAGDIGIDQVKFLERVGFDVLFPVKKLGIQSVQKALNNYSVVFQGSADNVVPASRKRFEVSIGNF